MDEYLEVDDLDDHIEHHGVRGMKWGVRRYQNYDGTYTQAGLKRFRKSLDTYEKADARYKSVKSSVKSGQGSKGDLTNAKLARKEAKKRLDKDYRHLKQDKLGDQGKELYARGKTITGNDRTAKALGLVGALVFDAAAYNVNTNGRLTKVLRDSAGIKITDKQFNAIAGGLGATVAVSAMAKGIKDEYQNKRLRAYYGHTSNY